MSRKKQQQKKNNNTNTLRIIAGDWRSRKLTFIDAPGLRPTPDRIRETLFNWLQNKVYGANCLDLFAGSGALGLEALSRGAADTVFVEKNKAVAAQLKDNLQLLKSKAPVIQEDALGFLSKYSLDKENKLFDLIFLDPPYRKGLLEQSLSVIKDKQLLSQQGLIYLEHESEESFDWGEYDLEILKQAKAGQVSSFLLAPEPNR